MTLPCKECLVYARCKNLTQIDCSILVDFIRANDKLEEIGSSVSVTNVYVYSLDELRITTVFNFTNFYKPLGKDEDPMKYKVYAREYTSGKMKSDSNFVGITLGDIIDLL